MTEFNLRELSAPLEALRPEVKAAYERLDARWDAILQQLCKLPIPCAISHTFWTSDCGNGYDCLEFKKANGKKRICRSEYIYRGDGEEEVTTIPYEEWSGEQRINMLAHVPGLFEEAAKRTKEFIEHTKE